MDAVFTFERLIERRIVSELSDIAGSVAFPAENPKSPSSA
jgi:hypothetical protein